MDYTCGGRLVSHAYTSHIDTSNILKEKNDDTVKWMRDKQSNQYKTKPKSKWIESHETDLAIISYPTNVEINHMLYLYGWVTPTKET